MNSIYFIGDTQSLSGKLERYFKEIDRDPQYPIHVTYSSLKKRIGTYDIPPQQKGLLFYELTKPDLYIEQNNINSIISSHPLLQWVLLVSSNIDYFDIASRFQIGNIIHKNAFDISVVRAITIRLMTGNVFGFFPYFPNGFITGPLINTISGPVIVNDILKDFENNILCLIQGKNKYRLKSYFYELLSNTIAYSVMGISSKTRDAGLSRIPSKVTISEDKPFKITFGMDDEKYGLSMMDNSGTLTLERILSKLRRQSTIGNEPHPPGVWDLTGRGLSLIQKDNRLIINIVKNTITEVIFLHYRKPEFNKYESVIIAEITPSKLDF